MNSVQQVEIAARSLLPFAEVFGSAELTRVAEASERLSRASAGGVVWNINSTARGGGVAELLRSLVGYARGTGADCRWLVIQGEREFFQLTKRLHNALHSAAPADFALSAAEHALYEQVTRKNLAELASLVRPGDVVILHDPQTAGLSEGLARHGAYVLFRCHIGTDHRSAQSALAWNFLLPYLRTCRAFVFTRTAHVPEGLPNSAHVAIIPPTIDPASPKNQALREDVVHSILVHVGLVEGPAPDGVAPVFQLEDGSPSSVRRSADVMRSGRAPAWDTPLIVQISRWDRLKDHLGVLRGFARYAELDSRAHLCLVGPSVTAVADDPEGAQVFEEVVAAFRALPGGLRARVHLASLPLDDAQENAVVVNALQRHARVVVQKSLEEGFGLTVAEAMWKATPVVASRVGGIQDQIVHEQSGLLIDDPRDPEALARALQRVLGDASFARRIGLGGQERIRACFLNLRSLYAYAEVIEQAIAESGSRCDVGPMAGRTEAAAPAARPS
jgi:trehalose synthase